MKVTAIHRGFIHAHLKEPGAEFQIPDEPKRKAISTDEVEQKIAKKGHVPQLFASSWMKPGWDSEKPQPALSTADAEESDTGQVI